MKKDCRDFLDRCLLALRVLRTMLGVVGLFDAEDSSIEIDAQIEEFADLVRACVSNGQRMKFPKAEPLPVLS